MNIATDRLAPRPARRSLPLLVIDDQPDQQRIIGAILQQTMPDVLPIWMSDGQQTLDYLQSCRDEQQHLPVLALLDLYLPTREAGWALLDQLKQRGFLARIPVIVLSHSDDPVDVKNCYELGATSYIAKPLTVEEWTDYFVSMRQYWFGAVTTPSTARR